LVGRARQLAALEAALGEVRSGHPVIVHVAGASGMGKSALVRRFLDAVSARDRAVVLAGRCCEREAVRFRAMDDAIDALGLHLATNDAKAVAPLSPENAAALVRLFPVLARVPALADAALGAGRGEAESPAGVSLQLRARSIAALRALLRHIGRSGPVVLCIDDAHWGDEDSAALLSELTAPPDPPGLLIVLAYRREWEGRAPLLIVRPAGAGAPVPIHAVAVDALDDAEARALVAISLDRAYDDPAVMAVVTEGAGNPFALGEFARHVRAAGLPATGLELGAVLHARFAELREAPLRLLQALSVAARPLPLALASRAAGLSREQGAAALRALRTVHLVRESSGAGVSCVEAFHDRVREAMIAVMQPEALIAQHARFVDALTGESDVDPEVLFVHCRGAGLRGRAADFAAEAAALAARVFAFARAAELYEAALELSDAGDARVPHWNVARADALACAARRRDAAQAYERAAASASTQAERTRLESMAIEQYLCGGHFDAGEPLAARVLERVNMPLAPTRTSAVVRMVARMLWLRVRGAQFTPRAAHQASREKLEQLDVCIGICSGLTVADSVRSSEVLLRTIEASLAAGEPWRMARALSMLSVMTSAEGPTAYSTELLDRSLALAVRVGDPKLSALTSMCRAMTLTLEGRWREGLALLERVNAFFNSEPSLAHWERDITQGLMLLCWYYMGEMREVDRRVPAIVADAVQRGDRYMRSLSAATVASYCWLARDDPETHAEVVRSGVTGPAPRNEQRSEHISAEMCLADNALYTGEPERAQVRLREAIPAATASLVLRIRFTLIAALEVEARVALALACRGRDRRANLGTVRRNANQLERFRQPWPSAVALLLRAGAADAEGRSGDAVSLYAAAAAAFDNAEMALYAALARRRLGEQLGGERGRALIDAADAWMAREGFKNPARFGAMLAPSPRS
jgi:hypothetical protein